MSLKFFGYNRKTFNLPKLAMELNGAEILVDCLQKEGVDHIFGYPGGAVLHIYDAIEAQDKITHVLGPS